MRGKSHRCLGQYLSKHYMKDAPKGCIAAFLFGCVEPDRNPVTYLKGSLRCQWLRGHNYRNARRYMRKLSLRLQKKKNWKLPDYYSLGKLIHYTADAFTLAHNDTFSPELSDHRAYEEKLQIHFLEFMAQDPQVDLKMAQTVMEAISQYHREYEKEAAGVLTDSRFALTACCCVAAILLTKPIL